MLTNLDDSAYDPRNRLDDSQAIPTDTDAIHDNVAAEIAVITAKATPVDADLLLIEDSAAANAKKRMSIGDLHAPYSLIDGTRAFTGVVAGIDPVADADLTTRRYVRDLVIPVDYVPDNINVATGDTDAGDVDSLKVIDDDDSLDIGEVVGVPGFNIEINFVSVVETPTRLDLHVFYTGSMSHIVNVQIYDQVGMGWDTLGIIPDDGGDFEYLMFDITNGAKYVKGDETVETRIYHVSSGNVTHDISIDLVLLRKIPVGGGGGITDHGALSDLLRDDHNPLYLLTDGLRPLSGPWAAGNDITGVTKLVVDNITLNETSLSSSAALAIQSIADLDLVTSFGSISLTAAFSGEHILLKSPNIQLEAGTDTDILLSFNGTTNQGTLTYMEDEDEFQFSALVQAPKLVATELYNASGDLKIMPDVQGDVVLFGDTDVADAAAGKWLYVRRNAPEGDNFLRFRISAGQVALLDSDAPMFLSSVGYIKLVAGNSMYLDLEDNAGAQKVYFRDSDKATIASIDSDGNLFLANPVAIIYGGSGQTTQQAAIDALTAVSGATDEYVLTKDTGSGNAAWKVAAGGGGGMNDLIDDTTPQLGGDLDGNDKIIYGSAASGGNLDLRSTSHGTPGSIILGSNSKLIIKEGTAASDFVLKGSSSFYKDGASSQWNLSAHNDTPSSGANLILRRSRNTFASPSIVTSGDGIGRLIFSGFDGTHQHNRAAILVEVDDAVDGPSDSVPMSMEFQTGTTALVTALKIDSAGDVFITAGNLIADARVGIGTDDPEKAIDIRGEFQQLNEGNGTDLNVYTYSSANWFDSPTWLSWKARGTKAIPLAVEDDDRLGIFQFRAYDGTSFNIMASLEAQIDGAVSTGNTPTELLFKTGTGSSRITRMVISPAGAVDVVGNFTAGTIQADDGFTGSFTEHTGGTVTVVGGIITGVA